MNSSAIRSTPIRFVSPTPSWSPAVSFVRLPMRTITTFLLSAVVGLVALSLTMLACATMLEKSTETSIRNQFVATVIGFIGLGLAASFDYRRTGKITWVIYGFTLLLLVSVLVWGSDVKGARRWLLGTQPSELAKLALIMALAVFGAARQHVISRFWKGLGLGFLIAVPILLLVAAEPDRGTTALLLLIAILMLLLAGVRWLYVVPPIALGVVGLAAMIVVSPMARNRIAAWWHPDQHKDSAGLQVRRSLQAFAIGRVQGQGLAIGAQKFRVPEVHTDFILPAIGEDLGVFGSLGVLGAYGVILVCGILIASRAPDLHGLLLAAGITFLISAQATVNIGVVTALLPNKGMPLPFISRGGTSIAVLLTMIGILLSVARQADSAENAEPGPNASRQIRSRVRQQTGRNPFANPDFAPAD